MLRHDNERLRAENMSLRESLRKPSCNKCSNPAVTREINLGEEQLRIENARLKEDLNRVCSLSIKFHNYNSDASSSATPMLVPPFIRRRLRTNMPTTSFQIMDPVSPRSMHNRSMYFELGMTAVEELVKLVQLETPLWIRVDDFTETLNYEQYLLSFPRFIGPKPIGFVSEATRASSIVMISSTVLVETLMDVVSKPVHA